MLHFAWVIYTHLMAFLALTSWFRQKKEENQHSDSHKPRTLWAAQSSTKTCSALWSIPVTWPSVSTCITMATDYLDMLHPSFTSVLCSLVVSGLSKNLNVMIFTTFMQNNLNFWTIYIPITLYICNRVIRELRLIRMTRPHNLWEAVQSYRGEITSN